MDRSFRSGLTLLAGFALLATAAAIHAILLQTIVWTVALALAGIALIALSVWALRTELRDMLRQRRGEIALFTVGMIGVLMALAYYSARFPVRFDMTSAGLFSLSKQTVEMLKRLDK
ncbi:MAG: hypothetical protein C5B46_06685, partial [Proteobacteria bacterium]